MGKHDQLIEAHSAQQDEPAPAAPPCAMVIFGAAGDLTKRLVVPALYNLAHAGQLSNGFQLVGVDLAAITAEAWRTHLTNSMKSFIGHDGEFHIDSVDWTAWQWLADRMSYLPGDLNDPATYRRLGDHLAAWTRRPAPAATVSFISRSQSGSWADSRTARSSGSLVEKNGQWRRVVIEKPFGHDLGSAKALNNEILKILQERQIYRIDHFLGKETVQNIMALRFANGLFEPLWSREHIDHIQITAAETIGVEHRGKFYEKTGALRDMVPNHMFQLLAMAAMEPPISFDADAVRAKKTEVLQAIKPLDQALAMEAAVRGQYDAGSVSGQQVRAYRQEPDVANEFKDRDLHCLQA